MSPDRKIGLAYVLERYHGGQYSRAYRLLSRINWEPRTDNAWRLHPRHEWSEARTWAAHYVAWMRHHKSS